MENAGAAALPHVLDDVKGWFPDLDQVLFEWILERQRTSGMRGDLLEVGAFMGKSGIFLGRYLQEGELFTVCDLFESEAPDGENGAEANKSYAALTRRKFETNYLAFHDELPHIVQGPSSLVRGEVAAGSCRFVHVDGSHLYEHVHGDIGAAREVLRPDGIVVLDDFRSEHTPGVAVAAWEAVLSRGLRPICLSTQKLYGTWGDPGPVQEELLAALRGRGDCDISVQHAAGHRLLRATSRRGLAGPAFPPSRHRPAASAAGPAPRPAAAPARGIRAARSRAGRIAGQVLPPGVARALRRSRRG